MAKRRTEYDPLDCIPSVDVIEQRLSDAQREARRLRVLLRTARAIATEAERPLPKSDREVSDE